MQRNELAGILVKHFIRFVKIYYCVGKTIVIYYDLASQERLNSSG